MEASQSNRHRGLLPLLQRAAYSDVTGEDPPLLSILQNEPLWSALAQVLSSASAAAMPAMPRRSPLVDIKGRAQGQLQVG